MSNLKSNDKISKPIELDTPIVRGDTKIEALQIRLPEAPDLDDFGLQDIADMKGKTVRALLPVISVPPITAEEVAKLDGGAILDFAEVISDFLHSKHRLKRMGAI